MPEPESNTRAITPPRTSPHNATHLEATTPERVRQVELNRLRGRYSFLCSLSPPTLSLVPCSLSLRYHVPRGNHFTQPRQDDAKKRRLLLLPRCCAIPTTKDPSPSSPRLRIPRLARRRRTIPMPAVAVKNNYGAMRVSGNTLTMICQRWSIRKVVSLSRMIGERTMI